MEQFTKFLAFVSPKGGAGKTTLSLLLSQQLVKTKQRIAYISLDYVTDILRFNEPHWQRLNGLETLTREICQNVSSVQHWLDECAISAEKSNWDLFIHQKNYKEWPFYHLQDVDLLNNLFLALQERQYHYVIFDLPQIPSLSALSVLSRSTHIFVVTEPFLTSARLFHQQLQLHQRFFSIDIRPQMQIIVNKVPPQNTLKPSQQFIRAISKDTHVPILTFFNYYDSYLEVLNDPLKEPSDGLLSWHHILKLLQKEST